MKIPNIDSLFVIHTYLQILVACGCLIKHVIVVNYALSVVKHEVLDTLCVCFLTHRHIPGLAHRIQRRVVERKVKQWQPKGSNIAAFCVQRSSLGTALLVVELVQYRGRLSIARCGCEQRGQRRREKRLGRRAGNCAEVYDTY